MNRIKYICSFLLLLLVGVACQKEDNKVFSEPASERAEKLVKELKAVITQPSNGWLMKIYTKDYEYGGYNVLVKFDDEGNVVAADELQEDPSQTTRSVYSYTLSDGPLLGFTTYNKSIHRYSEPASPLFIENRKMGGGSDFLLKIQSVSSDKVELKGLRNGLEVELTPLPTEISWQDFIANIQNTKNEADFVKVSITFNDKEYTGWAPMFNLSYFTVNDAEGNLLKLPFIYTAGGMEFPQDYTFAGKDNLPRLTLQSTETGEYSFVSADGNLIITSKIPTAIDFLRQVYWFTSKKDMGPYGRTVAEYLKEQTRFWNPPLNIQNAWYLGVDKETPKGCISVNAVYGGNSARANFMMEIIQPEDPNQGEVGFKFRPDLSPKDSWAEFFLYGEMKDQLSPFAAAVLPFAHAGTSIHGLRDTEDPRYFTTEMDNRKRPTWIKLIDVSNPDNWIKLSVNAPEVEDVLID